MPTARLLVADDERDILTLMGFVLEREGYAVATASNGKEVLAALGVEPENPAADLPDLILMDIMMPVLDGIQAAIRIGQTPRTAGLPIVVLTGQARETRQALAKAKNVVGLIEKPFEPTKLRETVAKILSEVRRG